MLRKCAESVGGVEVSGVVAEEAWQVPRRAEATRLHRAASTAERVKDPSESAVNNQATARILFGLHADSQGLVSVLHPRQLHLQVGVLHANANSAFQVGDGRN